jgi:hypothetical protein
MKNVVTNLNDTANKALSHKAASLAQQARAAGDEAYDAAFRAQDDRYEWLISPAFEAAEFARLSAEDLEEWAPGWPRDLETVIRECQADIAVAKSITRTIDLHIAAGRQIENYAFLEARVRRLHFGGGHDPLPPSPAHAAAA